MNTGGRQVAFSASPRQAVRWRSRPVPSLLSAARGSPRSAPFLVRVVSNPPPPVTHLLGPGSAGWQRTADEEKGPDRAPAGATDCEKGRRGRARGRKGAGRGRARGRKF